MVFYTGDHFLYYFKNGYLRRSMTDYSIDSNEKGAHTSHTSKFYFRSIHIRFLLII